MTECRIFSVEEAERTLPLVRRVMTDLLAAHAEWQEAVRAFELAGMDPGAAGGAEVLEAAARAVQARAGVVQRHLDELAEVGCVFKGFEGGLVDFHTLRDDRLVFLCWRMGEPGIRHWHELDAGFAGRQPLDHNLFTETD